MKELGVFKCEMCAKTLPCFEIEVDIENEDGEEETISGKLCKPCLSNFLKEIGE